MTCGKFIKQLLRQAYKKKDSWSSELRLDLDPRVPHREFYSSTPITPELPGLNILSSCEISCINWDNYNLPEPVINYPAMDIVIHAEDSFRNDGSWFPPTIGQRWYVRGDEFYIPLPALDFESWNNLNIGNTIV